MWMHKVAVAAVAAALGAMSGAALAADDTLVAAKVAKPPKLDGKASDEAWKKAKAIKVELEDGANHKDGKTTVILKAVYSGDMVYFLVQYADPTQSVRRGPYQKQADGTWKKLKDPDDKGGDNNKYYEDKFAFIWNIGDSIKGFDKEGCGVACHAGEADKPFGNKYLASEGELGDMWHMKWVRTGSIGQTDDQYLDHSRYDKEKNPNAGRKADPKTGGGYSDIKLKDGVPEFMDKSGKPANKGGTYWLKKENAVPMDAGKFKPGDEVASIMVEPFAGDRGDIATAGAWKNGQWTLEFARKLVTGSKYDVQFDKLDGTYLFGVAAFDNAQVRHAVHYGALKLKFAE